MSRTFEVREVLNSTGGASVQGGEVTAKGFEPLTSRFFDTRAGRLACKRALQKRLLGMGIVWKEEPQNQAPDLEGWWEE